MARKWSNLNLPGARHYVTGNFLNRTPVFTDPSCCTEFLQQLHTMLREWPSKLIAYASARSLSSHCEPSRWAEQRIYARPERTFRKAEINSKFAFVHVEKDGFHVWQESFKGQSLWSGWMIWQKINYIHANPVKARLVKSAGDYYWSSFNSFYSKGEAPLAVDHDWWWPDDSEKLSAAMTELGWYSYHKRK